MSPPIITVTPSPATADVAAALPSMVRGPDGAGRVMGADDLPAALTALEAGATVLICGRPADLDAPGAAARTGGGLVLVADPPWLMVEGATRHTATVRDWSEVAWALVAAVTARGGPAGRALGAALTARPPRADGAFVHETVQIDGAVTLGEGTRVWHFSKLLGPCTIGPGCTLGQNVVVERHVTIGRNVKIQNNVSVYSGVVLEDDVFCGPSMVFTNVGTPRSHYPRKGQYAITRVERGASIGANATVVCGHTLGAYSFVGAGAVVTRDVPAHALVYGNPARVRGWACYCGARLALGVEPGTERVACGECGRRYTRTDHTVRPEEETG